LEKSKGKKVSSTVRLIVVLVIGILVGAGVGHYSTNLSAPPAKTTTYTIGLASDLTGTGVSYGAETLSAAQIAISDVNSFLAQGGSSARFTISIEDSLSTTDGAVSAIKSLASAGDTIVMCHCSSGQVAAIESFAQSNKILVLVVASTSNLLAVPKEYIFRLIAPDAFQGRALATLIWGEGYRNVAAIYGNDPYSEGISGVFKTNFAALGGKVISEEVSTGLPDYSSEIVTLRTNVRTLGISSQTAVLFTGLSSLGVPLLSLASRDDTLNHVRWFTADGGKAAEYLPPKVPDSVGAYYLNTNLTGTFPQTLTKNTIALNFLSEFQAKTGHTVQSYGEDAYDGIWLLANTIMAVGSYNATAVKNLLPTEAQRMMGASGPMQMDSNGDRASQDYAIWTVVKSQGTYTYKNIGGWSASTGSVTFST
jgi:branched-chain amino acid transport system substrate-binding protein